MATKEERLFWKQHKNSVIDQPHVHKNIKFSEINLNQGHKNSNDELSLHSFNKSNKDKNFGCTVFSEKRNSWNKSATKDLTFKTLKNKSFDVELKERTQKRWMNEKNDSSSRSSNVNGSSTISLHIAAYENSFEACTNKDLPMKSNAFNTAVTVPVSKFQDPYEFPRQMDGNKRSTPEIQQFGAGQKLYAPNKKPFIKAVTKPSQETRAEPTFTKTEEVSITDDIRGADYYHGLMPKADVEAMLKKDGDFLLRKTENKDQIILSIAVKKEDRVFHYMVNQDADNSFYIEEHHESTVAALIQWHMETKNPLSMENGAKLRTPIERPSWSYSHDCVKLIKKLGEGAFGDVFLGEAKLTDGKTSKAAVKTMKSEASRESRLLFLKEARIMRKFNHKNVVKFYGVAIYRHPLLILMEYCPGGSLLSFLRKNTGKTSKETFLRFCIEAAEGLRYLHKKKIIHRDIAARNCLLTENNALKISDFGLSDERKFVIEDKLDKVPVKWLAIETLQSKVYSHKTDVWSFGVLLYEIYSEGGVPYPGWNGLQARAKIIVNDYRMEMPESTPKDLAALVAECWHKDPEGRPSFDTICQRLKEIKKQ